MERLSDIEIAALQDWLGTGSINIFGLPFSGKDTHGHHLAAIFHASVMGGGEILRNSVIPDRVKAIMEEGALIPTEDYIRIVLPYLSNKKFTDQPLILSSVGRWHGEETGVVSAAKASGHPIKAVVYLSVSESTAHERFLASREDEFRGIRADDAEHIVETRFEEFNHKTLPVIAYYRDHGLLVEVDGNPPIEQVQQAILHGLYAMATKDK